jgi:hypothetical protein
MGTRCSWMPGKCVPVGRIDCGNYHCAAGDKCSVAGCVPQDAVECGNHVCGPGFKCSSTNGCLPQDAAECGGGRFCNHGMKCASGNTCIAFDAVDCGTGRSCPAGNICVNGGVQCLTPQQLEAQAQVQQFAAQWNACKQYNIAACESALRLPQADNDQDREQLLSWESVAQKFQDDSLECKNGSIAACDMALASPAASSADQRHIADWRAAASLWNKALAFSAGLFASISDRVRAFPVSALTAIWVLGIFGLGMVFISVLQLPPFISITRSHLNWGVGSLRSRRATSIAPPC